MSMVFDTPDGIAFFQMGARKGALSLEIAGMKRHGQSAYSICKQVYGLRGTRESVLQQMEFLVEGAIARKHGWTEADYAEQLKGHRAIDVAAFRKGLSGSWISREEQTT